MEAYVERQEELPVLRHFAAAARRHHERPAHLDPRAALLRVAAAAAKQGRAKQTRAIRTNTTMQPATGQRDLGAACEQGGKHAIAGLLENAARARDSRRRCTEQGNTRRLLRTRADNSEGALDLRPMMSDWPMRVSGTQMVAAAAQGASVSNRRCQHGKKFTRTLVADRRVDTQLQRSLRKRTPGRATKTKRLEW